MKLSSVMSRIYLVLCAITVSSTTVNSPAHAGILDDPLQEIIHDLDRLNDNIEALNANLERFYPVLDSASQAIVEQGVPAAQEIANGASLLGFMYNNRTALLVATGVAAGACCIVSACRIDSEKSWIMQGCRQIGKCFANLCRRSYASVTSANTGETHLEEDLEAGSPELPLDFVPAQ